MATNVCFFSHFMITKHFKICLKLLRKEEEELFGRKDHFNHLNQPHWCIKKSVLNFKICLFRHKYFIDLQPGQRRANRKCVSALVTST